MVTLDCAIIVTAPRVGLVEKHVLPSVLAQGLFRQVLVVGDYWPGPGYRYIPVPRVTGTTLDALMKRDVAAVASDADALCYLCDDHQLGNYWTPEWPAWEQAGWDVLVPSRWVDGVEINNGMDPKWPDAPYCAGHAGIYRRSVLRAHPWMATPHTPLWDLAHSRLARASGFRFASCPDLWVLDIDPNPAEKPRHFRWGEPVGEKAAPVVD